MASETALANGTTESLSSEGLSSPAAQSGWTSTPAWHRIRFVLAVAFAAATIFYAATWMYYIRKLPRATLGFEFTPHLTHGYLDVTKVAPGGPADRAGLRPGDHVVSIYGRRLRNIEPLQTATVGGRVGDPVPLVVQRSGAAAPLNLAPILAPARPPQRARTPAEIFVDDLLNGFPVLFVVVGLSVLFLRLDDRNAWLLAICFAAFIASAPMLHITGLMPTGVRRFILAYMITLFPLVPAMVYYLFTTFPERSPLDRHLPWLKYVFLYGALLFSLPLAMLAFVYANAGPSWSIVDRVPDPWGTIIVNAYYFGACGLALFSLIWNSIRSSDREAKKKTRVMVWGTVLGLLPWMLLEFIATFLNIDPYTLPFWFWASSILAIFLLPLSFAYAVLKYRVLEIPVLLRRSARYLLVQRGFLILMLIIGTVATLALAQSFSQKYPSNAGVAIPVGVAFGMVLIGGGTWVQQRVSEKVDKAFFRSAYDSKQILEDLVEKAREVRTRTQLSDLLERNLRQALHPTFLMVYLLLPDDAAPDEDEKGISLDSEFLDNVFAHDEPFEVAPSTNIGSSTLHAECLVPVAGRDGQRLGLLVLGPRMSEEPYSREDKRLLAIVARQAGNTLESIQMAEEIAERIAAEKRSAHEIELARQVQRKLFPQEPPRVSTLDYAGECVQARVVGGDYYDFLELAPGLIGFALADISGKGFPAALLMANLQANLRSQYALAFEDMQRLLISVNHLFYENTEPNHYATMFFGCYDANSRKLRYVNCGHNPPILLRAGGAVERLEATATVMGLFPAWSCSEGHLQLHPGDLFAVYTDGVTEAAAPNGEEFGEERLIETLRQNRSGSAVSLLRSVIHEVQSFSSGEQGDDITVVIGKVL